MLETLAPFPAQHFARGKRQRVEDRARRHLSMPALALTDELLDRIDRLGGDERVE